MFYRNLGFALMALGIIMDLSFPEHHIMDLLAGVPLLVGIVMMGWGIARG